MFHHVDVPLLGVFRLYGHPYLFDCIWGEAGRVSAWVYRRLTLEDVARIDHADSADLEELLDEYVLSGPLTAVLAHESKGVRVDAQVDGPFENRAHLLAVAVEALEAEVHASASEGEQLASLS